MSFRRSPPLILACLILSPVSALSRGFQARELFRIPFGISRGALGARAESGNFSFPRDFTIDGAGRFYIYDALKHRIARSSPSGTYEVGFAYPATAGQA